MNKRCYDIIEIVREYGARGENIYWKKLAELLRGTASPPAVHKSVRQLVDDGELEERIVTSGRGIFKCFSIPNHANDEGMHPEAGKLAGKIDALAAKVDEILRSLNIPK